MDFQFSEQQDNNNNKNCFETNFSWFSVRVVIAIVESKQQKVFMRCISSTTIFRVPVGWCVCARFFLFFIIIFYTFFTFYSLIVFADTNITIWRQSQSERMMFDRSVFLHFLLLLFHLIHIIIFFFMCLSKNVSCDVHKTEMKQFTEKQMIQMIK